MADDAPDGFASAAGARIRTWWPYGLIAFLYLATSPYHQGLNNPNEMVRVYMTKAWVETGRFAIDPVIREWGMVDDKAKRNGALYSSKAPLQSLLGVVGYAVAQPVLAATGSPIDKRTITWVVRILGAAVFGIGFAWVLLAWCRRRAVELGATPRLGTAVGLALALGTMLYPYSITFTGHGLAALTAGGCYLAVVGLSRAVPGRRDWIAMGLLAGALGGAAPFAEYPAALVAAPALGVAFVIQPTWADRGRLFGALAAGGAIPFGVGLWAHTALWGHPFRTGYGFLENQSYVEVHGEGFFGVSFPKGEALLGALLSPGTGLFFFSPLLIVGFAAMLIRLAPRGPGAPNLPPSSARSKAALPLVRPLAVAAAVGVVASLYFISSHRGWRGGWTVGPRYIIAVAPVLGLWVVEAMRYQSARPTIGGLAALSIVTTGFASALYPHLSDVYTNPLATFLWPSYLAGETTYGLGHTLGLRGGWANAVHVVPLAAAAVFCAGAGLFGAPGRWAPLGAIVSVAAGITLVALIPEENPIAAQAENRRLWGFWEPARPGDGPGAARRLARPGRVFRARTAYRNVHVDVTQDDHVVRACRPFRGAFCRYGEQPWQRFGPEPITMAGLPEDVLFLHPIAGRAVRARVPVHPGAQTFVLRYGLADASVAADNPHPVELTLRQRGTTVARATAAPVVGLQTLTHTLTSTAPITLELRARQDGARVFGFDVEQYR